MVWEGVIWEVYNRYPRAISDADGDADADVDNWEASQQQLLLKGTGAILDPWQTE